MDYISKITKINIDFSSKKTVQSKATVKPIVEYNLEALLLQVFKLLLLRFRSWRLDELIGLIWVFFHTSYKYVLGD